MKEIELIRKRKEREKHFLKKNGVIVANVYDEDIHFLNNGIYEEIDNTLIDMGNYYENKNNAYKVIFYKTNKDGLTNISIGDNYIKTKLVDCNLSQLTENITESKLYKNVCYHNIIDNVDLQYKVMPTKVKESIVLKNKNVDLDRLVFSIETNMKLELLDKKIVAKSNDKSVFEFDAPYMIDADFKTNYNINYELLKVENNQHLLKLNIDKKWLSSEETKYPVMIDPTITNSGQDNNVYDTYIANTNVYENLNFVDEDILNVGLWDMGGYYATSRSLLKFELPTIGTSSQIIHASLNLIGYPVNGYPVLSQIVNIHRLTQDWNENNATWNTMHDKFDPKIEGFFYGVRSGVNGNGTIDPAYCGGDITRLVRKWYTGTPNYGIMLKLNEEVYEEIRPVFFSKNNTVSGVNPKPVLSISYRNQNGLLNHMDYQIQNFLSGKSYVNNYNGNLTTIFNVGSTVGGSMPINLNLVYNTNDVVLDNDYGYGLGYKLSLHQTIREQIIDGETYLEYCDEDGTLHYFLNKKTTFDDSGYNTTDTGNIYYDEDGLNLEITKNDNDYILNDINNNIIMKFTKNSNIAYLSEIEDSNGNKNSIIYTNNKITKVVDANGLEININYSDNGISIISPEDTLTLNYSDNKLININSLLGIISFEYNGNNIITKITDISGLKMVYEYYEQKPYKVKKMLEYGINNVLGEVLNITYGFDSTTVIDSKGQTKNIIFDSQGSIVSVSSLKGPDGIENAYSLSQINGTNDGTNPGYNNKTLSTQIPIKYVKNILSNTSFEKNDIKFIGTAGVSLSISNEYSETGINSLKAISNNANQVLTQTVNVQKGNYYTFSAFIKNTCNAKLMLSYLDENNEKIESQSELIRPSDSFERYDVTIEFPDTAKDNLTLKICLDEVGTMYIDDVQLEVGEVANNYNLLENSDFSDGFSDWTLNAHNTETGENVSTIDKFEVVTLNNGIKALKTKLNPVHSISMEKTFNINGKGGDTFNISFWYKNLGVDSNLSEHYGSRIYVIFKYTDSEEMGGCVLPSPLLNINDEAWQYVSNSFTAERDYTSITLRMNHEYTANEFYMTNMSLFKDVRSVNYQYDDNGNIIGISNLDNKENKLNYNKNNKLIQMIDFKGKNCSFEYDNDIIDRIKKGTTDMGVSTKIKYNNRGLPCNTKVIKDTPLKHIPSGSYTIRLKGTDKHFKLSNAELILNDTVPNDLWKIEKEDEYFKIRHSIIEDKYFSVQNDVLILSDYNLNSCLFEIIINDNSSYYIKIKNQEKYLKVSGNKFEFDYLDKEDYNFEFYFETFDTLKFIENNGEYDNKNFIKCIEDTLLNKITYTIDEKTGFISSMRNSDNHVINYEYNQNNKISAVKVGNKAVYYNYNNSKLSKLTFGNKNYNFDYDEFLNIKKIKIGEDILLITNNYANNNGKLLSSTFGNNQTIEYKYDEFDRIKEIMKCNEIIKYKYNNNGDLSKIITGDHIYKYKYDFGKRLSEYKYDDFKVKYLYDNNDNILNINYTFGDSINKIENLYNDDDSIIQTNLENNIFTYIYDSLGRLIEIKINDKSFKSYKYVTNGKRSSYLVDQITIMDDIFKYKYDCSNNITHIYRNGILEKKYFYDSLGELIKEHDYINNEKIIYIYDNVGNLLLIKKYDLLSLNMKDIIRLKYENEDWEDQLTKMNDINITYDEIGNPISIGEDIELSWNNGKELYLYSDKNNTITYKYNYDGIRTQKIVNGIATNYYLEGKNIVYEQRENNTLYFIRNSGNDLIGFKNNNNIYFYLKNLQNDIIGIINSDNEIVAKYKYDSWGNILSITNGENEDVSNDFTHIANINPFRYRSYYYDKETRFYYLNNRYYNPEWRRFLNIDSILNSNNDILSHNLYIYCSNNPINCIDDEGRALFSVLYNVAKKVVSKVKKVVSIVAKAALQVFTGSSTIPKKTTSSSSVTTNKKNVCPVMPKAPVNSTLSNYSTVLNNVLESNATGANKVRWTAPDIIEMAYFINNVREGGPWDYKIPARWKQEFGNEISRYDEPFIWNGYIITPEIFGNINYGYVGTAMGLPPEVLYMGGGFANKKGISLELFKGPYYGDKADDHCAVKFGIDLYNSRYK